LTCSKIAQHNPGQFLKQGKRNNRRGIKNKTKMKKVIFFLLIIIITTSCKPDKIKLVKEDNKELAILLDKYYDDRMQMFPLEATINGDSRFNNLKISLINTKPLFPLLHEKN
jgi:hypothetical protein